MPWTARSRCTIWNYPEGIIMSDKTPREEAIQKEEERREEEKKREQEAEDQRLK
jgi:hypothetical protein